MENITVGVLVAELFFEETIEGFWILNDHRKQFDCKYFVSEVNDFVPGSP